MKANPIESGYCTGLPLCTEFLEPGQGVQILHPDGREDRLCARHWHLENERIELLSRAVEAAASFAPVVLIILHSLVSP